MGCTYYHASLCSIFGFQLFQVIASRRRSLATAWETPWFMSVVCPTMRATVASATCWTTRSGAAGTRAALVPGHWCMEYTMNILPIRRNRPEIMKGLLLRGPALSNSTRSWKDPITGKLLKRRKKVTSGCGREASADGPAPCQSTEEVCNSPEPGDCRHPDQFEWLGSISWTDGGIYFEYLQH